MIDNDTLRNLAGERDRLDRLASRHLITMDRAMRENVAMVSELAGEVLRGRSLLDADDVEELRVIRAEVTRLESIQLIDKLIAYATGILDPVVEDGTR